MLEKEKGGANGVSLAVFGIWRLRNNEHEGLQSVGQFTFQAHLAGDLCTLVNIRASLSTLSGGFWENGFSMDFCFTFVTSCLSD